MIKEKSPKLILILATLAISFQALIARPVFAAEDTAFNASQLEKFLTVKAALLGISDNISLYFEDLNHNEEIAFDPTRSWIPASTIKAFVVPEVFRQKQLGLINFDDKVTIKAENVVATQMESDEFPTLREGTIISVGQLVEMMITQSDNTAYNTLLDILDRRNINATLRHFGMTETVVGEKLNLDDTQFQLDQTVAGRQPNTTTAKDFSALFSLLYDRQIPNSDEILAIFERQKINDMIPLLLPKDTVIAHKTGTWNPIFHDGGIVFKSGAPFILTIFSNGNDPSAIAQLARVAFFQNQDSVTEKGVVQTQSSVYPKHTDKVYLAGADTEMVLAAQSTRIINNIYRVQGGDTLWSISEKIYGEGSRFTQIINRNPNINPADLKIGQELIIPNIPGNPAETPKFPAITAADLGITKSDLAIDREDVSKISQAFLDPRSPIYSLKIWWENWQVSRASDPQTKIELRLKHSLSRLSEIKTLLAQTSDVDQINRLLVTSENQLLDVVALAAKEPNRDEILFRVSRINDARVALLGSAPQAILNSHQQQFIDMVYGDFRRQKVELSPKLASVRAANPLQQTPAIGQITSVNGSEVTLKFDSGESKVVAMDNLTPVRDFANRHLTNPATLKVGGKIAVIGQTGPGGKITPRFILNNMPRELPNRYEGTVTKIDAGNNTMEIRDQNGRIDRVSVNPDTTIKSKDTDVSLPGIRTGSTVTVYGSTSPAPSAITSPTPQKTAVTQTNSVTATSITVTKNGSGKKETEVKKTENKGKKEAPHTPTPAKPPIKK